jgi:hypothetical protein
LNELKSDLNKQQQNIFQSLSKINETAVEANYALSHLIASDSKPFAHGEFIDECLNKAAKIMCHHKVKYFRNIILTRNTVAERTDDIANNMRSQILRTFLHCYE